MNMYSKVNTVTLTEFELCSSNPLTAPITVSLVAHIRVTPCKIFPENPDDYML